jgi:hypothetical protein
LIQTQIYGIQPPDLVVLGAIRGGLEDMRRNPYLLDYCFAWFANDELTAKYYGAKEAQRAKDWFLNNKIRVSMASILQDVSFPLISISLVSSTEDRQTMSDIDSTTSEEVRAEDIASANRIALGPFTAKSYNSATGILTLQDDLSTTNLFKDMILVDSSSNIGYPILDIIDDTSFKIEPGTVANFTKAYVAPIDTFLVVSRESIVFKNTYSIRCVTMGEPIYTYYLNAIIMFILLRYREELLEARGLDASVIANGAMYQAQSALFGLESKELIFGQDITLTGLARQYWPKAISSKIQGIKICGLNAIGGTVSPISMEQEIEGQGWGTTEDFD